MNFRKVVLYALAAIGGAYLLMLVFVFFASSSVITPLRSVTSQDDQRVAELVIEETSSSPEKFVTLSIHRSDAPERRNSATLSGASTTDIELTWRTERQLEVVYPESLELSNMPDRLDDVDILYSPRR